MMKIGELNSKLIRFVIMYDQADTATPYKIYAKWYEYGWHRKLLAKHPDLYSCTSAINDYIKDHNETSR